MTLLTAGMSCHFRWSVGTNILETGFAVDLIVPLCFVATPSLRDRQIFMFSSKNSSIYLFTPLEVTIHEREPSFFKD